VGTCLLVLSLPYIGIFLLLKIGFEEEAVVVGLIIALVLVAWVLGRMIE